MKLQHSCSDTAFLIWHIVLNLYTFGYFLPASIGYARYHRSRKTILWVTILTGWTVVGWFVALIWACNDNTYTEKKNPVGF